MKINLLIIVSLIFVTSCRSQENAKQIYYYKDNVYEITISTIDNKVNEDGKVQCSKYQTFSKNDTLFRSYGYQLKSLISKSYKSSNKYFSDLPFDSLNNKYLDVKIKNYTKNKLNYDSTLSTHICKLFNIEIISIDSIVGGYTLEIKDSLKLNSHKALQEGGIIKYTGGIWVASCVKLYELAKILDDNSIKYVSSDNSSEDCYSIEFYSGSDIEKINTKLNQYGLTFNKNDIIKRFYIIKTVANNR